VPEEDLWLAMMVFADVTSEGELDMAAAIEDDGLWKRNENLIAPDAKVRFVSPDVAGVQVMDQDFEGIEGLRTGWRTWLEPWDRYRIKIDEMLDAGGGLILVLVTSTARMRDSEMEVPQSAASMFRVKEGRIVEISFYLDQAQARRDAGLD
jgi:ketosteroid isomerase-like protein